MNKKEQQLGMNPGTAANQLRKIILFDFVKINHLDICFHCNDIIKSENELSIEHKVPWLDSEDPKGLFFSLENKEGFTEIEKLLVKCFSISYQPSLIHLYFFPEANVFSNPSQIFSATSCVVIGLGDFASLLL